MLTGKWGKSRAVQILFVLPLALLCISGCLEKAAVPIQEPSSGLSDPSLNSMLQMDYDVELSHDLFRMQGHLLLPGAGNLAYVQLNASLSRENSPIFSTKYLLMQIESSREYGFEICKSCWLEPGEYDCLLRAEGPQGVIAEGTRRVSLEQFRNGPKGWSEAEEAAFWRMIEEREKEAVEGEDGTREDGTKEDRITEDGEEEIGKTSKSDAGAVERTKEASGEDENANESDDMERSRRPASSESGSRAFFSAYPAGEDGDPISSQEHLLVGSISSRKYHLPDCRYAQKIKPENLVTFSSSEEAEREGYLPCKVCNP